MMHHGGVNDLQYIVIVLLTKNNKLIICHMTSTKWQADAVYDIVFFALQYS